MQLGKLIEEMLSMGATFTTEIEFIDPNFGGPLSVNIDVLDADSVIYEHGTLLLHIPDVERLD